MRDPAPRHLDTAFIPATAFFAAVVHPQAVLSSSDAEAIPKEAITLAAQRAVGFDPLKIDEAVFVSALTSEMRQPPLSGFVLRFTEAYSKEHVVSKLRAPKNVDLNGKTVFQPAGRGAMSFYFPDERTIVIAELPMLKQMLAAKDVDSPLINLLKRVDVSAEATALLSMDALRDLWHQALAHAPPIPPRFQPFLKLPDLLTAAMVRIDIGQRFKARLTLRARDDAAGQEIESLVNQGLEMARQAAQAEIAKLPRQSDDPVDEAANRYLARITNKLFGLIKPFRTGQNVSIVVETGGGPATLGILVGMLLPAVQAARAAANRNTNLNKLRQIALAMHNYESGKRRFPARAIFDKNGKPLLSWRVKLLPVLGEANLYNQFHLDEPWDSEHNKALINETSIYAKAGGEDDGKTVFLVPVGKGLGFEGDEGISPGAIADGESRTIMAVEANDDRAVPWTKPDDLEVDLNKPLDGLGDAEPGGLFGVVFFDGHAAFIHKSTDPDIIKALFTRAGGEVVNPP
ncbi:MAG TPA: DUF1559 domain-containing protein [Pirellulales bacterium]|nr:DUF1559 domain-containing protein [Pirellulales bacterium]